MREFWRRIGESARQAFEEGQLARRKKLEKSLTPLEKVKVLPIAREVVAEANKLLKDEDQISRVDSNGRTLVITGRKQARKERVFSNAELLIETYYYRNGASRIGSDTYVFYPNGVDNFRAIVRVKNRRPDEPDIRTRNANAKDLTKLLKNIRASQPQI